MNTPTLTSLDCGGRVIDFPTPPAHNATVLPLRGGSVHALHPDTPPEPPAPLAA